MQVCSSWMGQYKVSMSHLICAACASRQVSACQSRGLRAALLGSGQRDPAVASAAWRGEYELIYITVMPTTVPSSWTSLLPYLFEHMQQMKGVSGHRTGHKHSARALLMTVQNAILSCHAGTTQTLARMLLLQPELAAHSAGRIRALHNTAVSARGAGEYEWQLAAFVTARGCDDAHLTSSSAEAWSVAKLCCRPQQGVVLQCRGCAWWRWMKRIASQSGVSTSDPR